MSFVHLHLHSQYSLLEATTAFKPLVKMAKQFEMPAVALTDAGNMFGAVEFYFAAKDAGVKPILGIEVFLAPKSRLIKGEDKESANKPLRRLVLLAQNLQGYRNLCQISSIGFQEGFYYRPRVDYEILEKYASDVLALSGGLNGEVASLFLQVGADAAFAQAAKLKEIYQDRFYMEVTRTGVAACQQVNPFLLETAKQLQIPIVAANDVYYLKQEDQVAQEVLICIGTNRTLQDESRFRLGSDQFYFKSPEQMRALFHDIPEAADRTLEIAERCNVSFKLKDDQGRPIYHLPSFPTENGRSLKDEISLLAKAGLEKRFAEAKARQEEILQPEVYFQRLDYELSVIEQMGFSAYFLIVQDFINWAKTHDIPVGPGRGSGAGSLVAYSLNITDLDPMPYNLIFERFLNPERVSMPDFDVDFCQENRGRVIEYVTQKYGQPSVSQIITYGKLQARAAIRDVGRVMGMTYAEVDVVAKLVPEKLGITLKEAIEMEPRLRDLMDQDPKVNTLMDLAQRVEGLVRHAGIHAAGVIIAEGQLVDHAPLYRGVEGENVIQYDMKHAEKMGLIKFDFLGLKTLTHIQEALQLIATNRGKKVSTSDISLSDPGIYSIMCRGDTAGIFQFEGEGITDLIRKAKPSCFEDIVAINALYRPGPMDMIPSYLQRKHGEVKVDYLFPELNDLLKETYGIIVYQEQVQTIAARIAKYSLGEADLLRRAMGKKITEEMAKQKERFLSGAKEGGFDAAKSEELFDLMAEFANYGFNKSHAAAYCVVAAQTAWLKNYYPVEFFAALLSCEMSDTDKIVKYSKDAQKHNIAIQPPSISHSRYRFTVKDNNIYFSLGAIKGVGESAVEAIVEARAKTATGVFTSLEEFFELVDLRRVNKKTIECLIKAGALDGFGYNRHQLLTGYTRFIERAERIKKDRAVGQTSLFGFSEAQGAEEQIKLEEAPELSRSTRLAFEKEVLGFFLSDHPLNGYDSYKKFLRCVSIADLVKQENKSQVRILIMLTSLREIITKKGTRMAFLQVEDLSGAREAVVFPDTYAKFERELKEPTPLILTGTLEKSEDSQKLLVEYVETIDSIFRKAKKLRFHLKDSMQDRLKELKDLFARHPGEVELLLEMEIKNLNQFVELEIKDQKVKASPQFLEQAQELLGDNEVFDIL